MTGHVALCVVYLVDEAAEFLFYKHLEQIQACSRNTPIRIYAGVNRLSEKYRDHLRGLDFVKLCELEDTDQRNSHEHAHYLDQLTVSAIADGAAFVGALDVDSFPVDPAWLERCHALFRQGCALVGVLRTENGDVAAPHPSFMLFPRAFYEAHQPTYQLLRGDSRAEAFMRATGQPRLDTGTGYGLVLHEERLPWARLLRSNKIDDHPLMAGIYGGMIFHFGGGSREKVFSVDIREARKTRPSATLEALAPEIAARNERVAGRILEQMKADFPNYVRRLLGA